MISLPKENFSIISNIDINIIDHSKISMRRYGKRLQNTCELHDS